MNIETIKVALHALEEEKRKQKERLRQAAIAKKKFETNKYV